MIPTRQQIIRKPSRGAIFITLHNNTSAKLDCERGASTLRFCSRLAPLSPVWRTAREVQECHSRVGMTSTTGAGVTPPHSASRAILPANTPRKMARTAGILVLIPRVLSAGAARVPPASHQIGRGPAFPRDRRTCAPAANASLVRANYLRHAVHVTVLCALTLTTLHSYCPG